MDTSVDFMPTQNEFRLIAEKIKNSTPSEESRKRNKSIRYDSTYETYGDFYDDRGRNISRLERRQELVPWVRVIYRNGKLYIPIDKKNVLRSMRLL